MTKAKETKLLKKGSKFTVITEAGEHREEGAWRDITLTVEAEKLGFVYFKLGYLFCRAEKKLFNTVPT